ncbi:MULTISPECIES: hypothetical protein [unclassified Lentimonas]|uniref:hypothetical protein n=1 Tax=unclassified Lentimonas TaxID=2630993 RepID=UPI001322C825|nr:MULTISPECIES: hypothetical protein [unclassified Lentimonas]CAA6678481.1 Unannotated [Lentimonas sp. CC4]CAA6687476.1 Unannotated [Lentimonas sp. CC6]CAA7078212.1 Unannotated [Lentimonas sp. CC4]CAA7171193.1 Unannotated [Lentimonas sp. CC21]CAA7183521.1 Unannotated [Lentimonas sp. CC8]
MDSEHKITLTYSNRETSFKISSAVIWRNSDSSVCIEIEGEDIKFDGNNIDSAYGAPMINATWKFSSDSFEALSKTKVFIPESYDPEIEDHVSTLYLSEHLDFDECNLSFGELKEGTIPITFSGISPSDPTGTEPDEGIKVSGSAILTIQ